MTSERHQRISAHVHGEMKALPVRMNVGIREVFFVREGDGVNQNIQCAPFLFQSREDFFDLFIFRYVTGKNNLGTDAFGQWSNPFLQNFSGIRKGQLSAFGMKRFRDRPGDAPVVRNSENHRLLSIQKPHLVLRRQKSKVKSKSVLLLDILPFYFLLFTFSTSPRCQRYSSFPVFLLIQRESTKKRSLKRFTYFIGHSLNSSARDSRTISRSALRQTVRHWCRYAPILPPPGSTKDLRGSRSF